MKRSSAENIWHEGSRYSRRQALRSIVGVVGGYAVAQSLAPSVLVAATAQSRAASDVDESSIQYPSGDATIQGFLAKPKGEGQHPAVIVIHSLSGLDKQIQDLTRRFAAEGFAALAPNLASRDRGSNTDRVEITVSHLAPRVTVQDVKQAYDFLSKDSSVDPGKISAVGFEWGGWRAFMLAEDVPNLYRAVVYYGATATDGLENIKAPVLAHYAGNDFRVTGNALWTDQAMKQLGKSFTYVVYDNADAGFMTSQDTSANTEAAQRSWNKTLEFLRSPS